jgi:hypothetical protein
MRSLFFLFLLLPSLLLARTEPKEPISRGKAIALESGLGLLVGGAAAGAAFGWGMQTGPDLDGFRNGAIAAGIGGGIGSGLGVALGGRLGSRSGSVGYTVLASLAGQAVGAAAGMGLYSLMNPAPMDTPIALGVTFSMATIFGVLGYNMTDR